MTNRIVIVGGGQAALQVSDGLRRNGYEGSVGLFSGESFYPYQRPPLSKGFLTGAVTEANLIFRKPDFFDKRNIDVHLNSKVVAIDVMAKTITTDQGSELPYDQLALATGARVRPLPTPGTELKGVHYLRTLEDTKAIIRDLGSCQNVVVIGGGFIGLEVAASATKLGKSVTCIEAENRVLGRVVSPTISDFFAKAHRDRGTEVVLNRLVTEIYGKTGRVSGVRCDDNSVYPADLVVIGIGVVPNQELAEEAGLVCDNGIIVDQHTRTSDTHVVAAGDCTNHPNPYAGGMTRLESVQNAIDQAKTAAANLCGKQQAYNAAPWFWSDQYDLKLQIVGFSRGADTEVIRGSMDDEKFSIFYFRNERLLAIDSVNSPGDHLLGRKLLNQDIPVRPDQVADTGYDLKSLL